MSFHYTEDLSRRWLILPLLLLYLLHLGGVGLLGPDEPRYASIGREMARSGDWVTPRLDTQPWFEKPPLTYWLTASGHRLGLTDEWAARFPQALLSLAFLIFFYLTLAREFSPRFALAATVILATSASWLAYSFTALTDLPMSAALGSCMLLLLVDTRAGRTGILAGAFLGLAILGKGFVPVVLIAPVVLIVRGKRLGLLAGTLAIAAPWFVLCWLANGSAFWDDFFWKQHVARFLSPSLEHVQPFWYYIPVLLGGLFPWTPLVGALVNSKIYRDIRILSLGVWILYGLLFFSMSRNKLPGYILPLLPALAVVLAAALQHCQWPQWSLAGCAVLLAALPTVAGVLPDALLLGLSRARLHFAPEGFVFLLPAAAVWWLVRKGKWEEAVVAVALVAGLGVVYLKYTIFPVLDETVSARAFWRAQHLQSAPGACLDRVRRSWEYGLNYYAQRPIPQCSPELSEIPHIVEREKRLAVRNP
jgi:4-amino-4-deoxy-L-arabinose transferase